MCLYKMLTINSLSIFRWFGWEMESLVRFCIYDLWPNALWASILKIFAYVRPFCNPRAGPIVAEKSCMQWLSLANKFIWFRLQIMNLKLFSFPFFFFFLFFLQLLDYVSGVTFCSHFCPSLLSVGKIESHKIILPPKL